MAPTRSPLDDFFSPAWSPEPQPAPARVLLRCPFEAPGSSEYLTEEEPMEALLWLDPERLRFSASAMA